MATRAGTHPTVVSNDVFDEDDEGDRDVGQAAQGRQPTLRALRTKGAVVRPRPTTLATLDIGERASWLEAEAPRVR